MKKDEILLDRWSELYKKNKFKFDALKGFLKKNTKHVRKFHKQTTINHVSSYKTATEKLYILFLNSLNAAGGNNLDKSAEATKIFIPIIDTFQGKSQINFKEFLGLFAECDNSQDLFGHLKEYPNFRFKKTALFFMQLSIIQSTKHAIFKNISSKELHKVIPLDVVIMETISLMLGLQYKNRISYAQSEIFNQWCINKWGKDFFLFEDIWFWGYFGSKVRKKDYRSFSFNESKLVTNPWIYPPKLEPLIPIINQFCRIINKR